MLDWNARGKQRIDNGNDWPTRARNDLIRRRKQPLGAASTQLVARGLLFSLARQTRWRLANKALVSRRARAHAIEQIALSRADRWPLLLSSRLVLSRRAASGRRINQRPAEARQRRLNQTLVCEASDTHVSSRQHERQLESGACLVSRPIAGRRASPG